MAIKVIKMISGDEIISEFVEEDSCYVLKNPQQISMVASRTGQPTFGLIPYPLTSNDKEIRINKNFVAFMCNPAEDFETQYKSITGVGIVVPPKDIILN